VIERGIDFGMVCPDIINRAGRTDESIERDKDPPSVVEGGELIVGCIGGAGADFPTPSDGQARGGWDVQFGSECGGGAVGGGLEAGVGVFGYDMVVGEFAEFDLFPTVGERSFKVFAEQDGGADCGGCEDKQSGEADSRDKSYVSHRAEVSLLSTALEVKSM